MTGPYIGPERRKGERRGKTTLDDLARYDRERADGVNRDRRVADRRQEALAGVIVGLTAEDMVLLASFWQAYEAACREIGVD